MSSNRHGRLRVSVLVEHFPPRMGSDRRIYELMKPLAKRHEINFLCVPSFRELNGMIQPEASDVSCDGKGLRVCDSIIGHDIGIPNALRQLWRKSIILAYVLNMTFLAFKAIRVLKKINSQAIVLNYPSVYTGILGLLAAKVLRKPCILDFNDLIAQYTINLLNKKRQSIIGRLIIRLQDLIIKWSDTVIAPTSYLKNYALRCGVKNERIFVIPNGVNLKMFNKEAKSNLKAKFGFEKKEVCLYFGRFDEWAGTSTLREVGVILEQKRPDTKFLLVGEGNRDSKFPDNTVLISQVPHDQVPEVVSVADVVLVPFPENEVSHAASPLKLFEAMAVGKPIVASRVSGIREVVKDGYDALLVDPSKPEEWVKALEVVLDSKELQAKLSANAQERVKKYDWEILASQFEDALLE